MTLPGSGTLTLNGTAVTAGQVVPVASISAGQLVFTPAAGGSGSPYASFQFSVGDGTAASGSATETVNVAPLAPTTADHAVTAAEAGSYAFATTDFPFTDPDGDGETLQSVTIASLPGSGALTLNGAAVTAGQVVPVASLGAGQLVFAPAAGGSGSAYASFGFQVSDGTATSAAATETVNVTPVAPTTADHTVTAPEGGFYAFAPTDFPFTDPDNDGESLQSVTIATLPGSGTLALNGTAAAAGQVVPVASLNAGQLVFTPAAGAAASPYASFRFSVGDGTASSANATETVNVTPAAPTTADHAATAAEGGAYTFATSDFPFADPDNDGESLQSVTIVTLPGSGTLTLNGAAVTAGQAVAAASLNAGQLVFTPAAGASGSPYASFQFSVSDGTASSVSATETIGVTPVAPTTADHTVTLTEGGAYTFRASDFPFTDPDGDGEALQSVAIASLPAGGALTLNGTAVTAGQVIPAADITAGQLVFTPAAGGSGSPYASFGFRVGDGTASSAAATEAIDITPIALTTGDHTATVTEGSPYTFGAGDFPFTDPDGDGETLQSVSIATLPGSGTLALNGNAVAAGQVVTAASISAGQLVFTPAAGGSGSPYASFQFSVSDGTAASGTATQTVNVTPAAPATADHAVTAAEGGSYAFAAGDFPFTDPDGDGETLQSVTITSLPGSGALTLNGTAVTAGQVVPVASIGAGQLVFAPAAGASGSAYASFGFQISDGTASSGSATETVNVTPVAPTTADHAVTAAEGGAYAFAPADFPFTDPEGDGESLQSVTIATLPGSGTLALNGTAVAAGQVVPVASLNAGQLVFTPAAGGSGSPYASFQFRVSDGTASSASATETIGVTPVAPTTTDHAVTLTEGGAYTFRASDFPFTDPDGDGEALQSVTIASLPASGALTLNGAAVTAGQAVPAADIAAGQLVFTPAAGGSGSPYASFGFRVGDGAASSGSATETVNVTPVAPTTADHAVAAAEGGSYAFAATDFPFTDPDGDGETLQSVTIASLPGSGTLTLGGTAVAGGQVVPVASLNAGQLVFTPAASGSGSPYASFGFQVSDGTAASGTATETVNVTPALPTTANNTATTSEGNAYTFGTGDFPFTDPDNDGETLQSVTITTLPASGALTLNGTAVAAGQVVPAADITAGRLVFTPAAGGSGSAYASFGFTVGDGTAASSSATETVDVTAAPPTTADHTAVTPEGGAYSFGPADFPLTDPDGDGEVLQSVTITSLPGSGALRLNGVAVTAGQVIPAADLRAGDLVFMPAAGATGSPYAAFGFQVSDGTATSAAATESIDVTPVGPVTANGMVATTEGHPYTFGAGDFPFTDPDADGETLQSVTITSLPAHGTLTLNGTAVTAGQVVPAASIRAGQLVFTPAAGATGSPYASFGFRVSDGTTASAPATLAIQVTAVAPPANGSPVQTPSVQPPSAQPASGTITGVITLSVSIGGSQRHRQRPAAGVVVTLPGLNDRGQTVLLTTRTGPDGRYYFGDLEAGFYTISVTPAPGYLAGPLASFRLESGAFESSLRIQFRRIGKGRFLASAVQNLPGANG